MWTSYTWLKGGLFTNKPANLVVEALVMVTLCECWYWEYMPSHGDLVLWPRSAFLKRR